MQVLLIMLNLPIITRPSLELFSIFESLKSRIALLAFISCIPVINNQIFKMQLH